MSMFHLSLFSLVCLSLCLCSTSPLSLLSVCLYVLPLPFLVCVSLCLFVFPPLSLISRSVCLYVCVPPLPLLSCRSVFMSMFHLSPFSLSLSLFFSSDHVICTSSSLQTRSTLFCETASPLHWSSWDVRGNIFRGDGNPLNWLASPPSTPSPVSRGRALVGACCPGVHMHISRCRSNWAFYWCLHLLICCA